MRSSRSIVSFSPLFFFYQHSTLSFFFFLLFIYSDILVSGNISIFTHFNMCLFQGGIVGDRLARLHHSAEVRVSFPSCVKFARKKSDLSITKKIRRLSEDPKHVGRLLWGHCRKLQRKSVCKGCVCVRERARESERETQRVRDSKMAIRMKHSGPCTMLMLKCMSFGEMSDASLNHQIGSKCLPEEMCSRLGRGAKMY